MAESNGSSEIALAGRALIALRNSLRGEVGDLPAVHALHAAGFEAGEDLAPTFLSGVASSVDGGLDSVSGSAFWSALGAFFRDRGWGRLEHDAPHPGVGMLVGWDWAESDPDSAESQPTCQFSAGIFSSLLTRAAGGPIAVLEIECRSRGDEACRFVFGEQTTIHRLYGELFDGSSFDDALAEL